MHALKLTDQHKGQLWRVRSGGCKADMQQASWWPRTCMCMPAVFAMAVARGFGGSCLMVAWSSQYMYTPTKPVSGLLASSAIGSTWQQDTAAAAAAAATYRTTLQN
jgi:hypothetical protein